MLTGQLRFRQRFSVRQAMRKKPGVVADQLGGRQDAAQMTDKPRADIAQVSGDQDSHVTPDALTRFSRALVPGPITPQGTACRAMYPSAARSHDGNTRSADRRRRAVPSAR